MRNSSFMLVGLLLAAVAIPSSAFAATAKGYVCSVALDPRAGAMGSSGSILFTLTEQPLCGGAVNGSYRVLSTGGDSSFTGFRYSSTQLLAMFDQLVRASAEELQVQFGYTGGASGNGANEISFTRR